MSSGGIEAPAGPVEFLSAVSDAFPRGTLPGLCTGIEQTELLVDAEIYYASFCRAALRARRSIYLIGWQFDSLAQLLRVEAPHTAPHPVEFLPFLEYLCERTPELEIFVLAWDYSIFYALEREWLQKLKFDFQSHARVHFEFADHPSVSGCLHQKFVVIDEAVAFVGGLDVCDSRWDTRAHIKNDPRRMDAHQRPYKAFHDVQVAARGPIVAALARCFRESWRRARGLGLPSLESSPAEPHEGSQPPEAIDLRELSCGRGLPLRATRVALSRTDITERADPGSFEVQALFERALGMAERLIYIETQYFTSRAIAAALCRRFADTSRSKLAVVLVMPDGADTPKEDLVLGDAQRAIRRLVADRAAQHGHEFRLLRSSPEGTPGRVPSTCIHAKLLIVDDELLSVGSANLTNRSMSVDTELNVTYATSLESPSGADALRADICAIRAGLLAEHAGSEDVEHFASLESLIERLDAACLDPLGKLWRQPLPEPEGGRELLTAIFDPAAPLDWENIDETLADALRS